MKPKKSLGESLGGEVTVELLSAASFTEEVGKALASVLRKG